MVSGSIEWENHFRLDILAKNHHNWLVACAKNISNDIEMANDLVGDL